VTTSPCHQRPGAARDAPHRPARKQALVAMLPRPRPRRDSTTTPRRHDPPSRPLLTDPHWRLRLASLIQASFTSAALPMTQKGVHCGRRGAPT
jgi:hypothetical protein